MNILIKKNPDALITPESINFTELVRNSKTILNLSNEYKTNMIKILNEEFTEQEQQWYIANLYIYLNYHPTNDYPINLENVFHMIGFANKGNAMKTIKSNFTKDEDYKILLFPTPSLNSHIIGFMCFSLNQYTKSCRVVSFILLRS
jgi:hypothetical protein